MVFFNPLPPQGQTTGHTEYVMFEGHDAANEPVAPMPLSAGYPEPYRVYLHGSWGKRAGEQETTREKARESRERRDRVSNFRTGESSNVVRMLGVVRNQRYSVVPRSAPNSQPDHVVI
ncbi:hypothetical protein KM043_016765 [Ampulex compressa]|nr:hypothetical protein KM043_016765 [Ampulex compressa]